MHGTMLAVGTVWATSTSGSMPFEEHVGWALGYDISAPVVPQAEATSAIAAAAAAAAAEDVVERLTGASTPRADRSRPGSRRSPRGARQPSARHVAGSRSGS